MTGASTESLSVVIERELAHPPEKIWRALTQPHLIEDWLMKNNFKPVVGHRFDLHAEWGGIECEVVTIEPQKVLSYNWAARGLDTVVTWTLTPAGEPTGASTRLRMEQVGFTPDQKMAYRGATAGWPRFLAALEQLVERLD